MARKLANPTAGTEAPIVANLIQQAEAAGGNSMPAYTHLQRAEPVLVAHWLLAYVEMFLRDMDRLVDCRKRLNVCPLGSGAVARVRPPVAVERLALLSLCRPAGTTQRHSPQRYDRRSRTPEKPPAIRQAAAPSPKSVSCPTPELF